MPVQFVVNDFAVERIAVDPKNLGGLGLVSTCLGQRSLDESLFEFTKSLVQINPAVNHLCNKGFQLLFHNVFLVGLIIFLATSAPAPGSQPKISLSFRRESLQR